jgi:hypothetical protein
MTVDPLKSSDITRRRKVPYLFTLACNPMLKLLYNLIQNRFDQLFHAEEEIIT